MLDQDLNRIFTQISKASIGGRPTDIHHFYYIEEKEGEVLEQKVCSLGSPETYILKRLSYEYRGLPWTAYLLTELCYIIANCSPVENPYLYLTHSNPVVRSWFKTILEQNPLIH